MEISGYDGRVRLLRLNTSLMRMPCGGIDVFFSSPIRYKLLLSDLNLEALHTIGFFCCLLMMALFKVDFLSINSVSHFYKRVANQGWGDACGDDQN